MALKEGRKEAYKRIARHAKEDETRKKEVRGGRRLEVGERTMAAARH